MHRVLHVTFIAETFPCGDRDVRDRQRGAHKPPPQPQEHSPVSGSHWCSQGSRRRRAQRSRAQGPLEFCWEKSTTCAGFSQSLASSWLPSSRMNRLPATTQGESLSAGSICWTLHPPAGPSMPRWSPEPHPSCDVSPSILWWISPSHAHSLCPTLVLSIHACPLCPSFWMGAGQRDTMDSAPLNLTGWGRKKCARARGAHHQQSGAQGRGG